MALAHTPDFVNGSRIDNNTVVYDSSGYKNHGLIDIERKPDWTRDCVLGEGAFKFGGQKNFINKNFLPSMKNSTISLWFQLKDYSNQIFFAGSNGVALGLYNSSQIILTTCKKRSPVFEIGSLDLNKWHHIAAVYGEDSQYKLFLNGVKALKTASSNCWTFNKNESYIGSRDTGTFTSGSLDDLRIYATALTESEVIDIYEERAILDSKGNLYIDKLVVNDTNIDLDINKKGELISSGVSNVSIADGLIAWWPLDGHLHNMTGDKDAIGSSGDFDEGLGQQSYKFNGLDTKIDVSGVEINRSSTYKEGSTVSLWVNPNPDDPWNTLFNRIAGHFYFTINNGRLQNMCTLNSVNYWHYTKQQIPSNTWTHVVAVIEIGKRISYYVNGKEDNTALGNFSIRNDTDTSVLGEYVNRYFKGNMQDVRIFNRALSGEEIEILYKTTNNSETKMEFYNNKAYITGEFKEV